MEDCGITAVLFCAAELLHGDAAEPLHGDAVKLLHERVGI
jgi:hypothetical protein